MNHARDVAGALPGGELLIEQQDEIIAMLERLRAKKRYDQKTATAVQRHQIGSKTVMQITIARLFGQGH
jgi:hypothetical protein